MIDDTKKKNIEKKPPTQTAGVSGIDAHGAMGDAPSNPTVPPVNWQRLIRLPAFELFVSEQSGQSAGSSADNWVRTRRHTLSDAVLYQQYSDWHKDKGFWPNESPDGLLMEVQSD